MTIILTGGGSGGHITPILAVAAELKRIQPDAQLVYIGQTGDDFARVVADSPFIDQTFSVRAGKLRRYHGEGLKQLLDVPTQLKNLRDAFYVVIGIWQSWRLIGRLRPQVVFTRGGFVSVPVAWAARYRKVPYITHDSDRTPSLANKLIARHAARHAVAFPKQLYPYPANKTELTGIPVRAEFSKVDANQQARLKRELKIPEKAKVLFVIGGGLGSDRINQALIKIIKSLMAENHDLYLIHSVGRAHEASMRSVYDEALSGAEQGRLKLLGFVEDIYRYSGAADLIIMRAGATNLAEFALQAKPCIVVPSSFLSGGHQLQNAKYLSDKGAISVLSEDNLSDQDQLKSHIQSLLRDDKQRLALANKLAEFAQPEAATRLAELIIQTATPKEDRQ